LCLRLSAKCINAPRQQSGTFFSNRRYKQGPLDNRLRLLEILQYFRRPLEFPLIDSIFRGERPGGPLFWAQSDLLIVVEQLVNLTVLLFRETALPIVAADPVGRGKGSPVVHLQLPWLFRWLRGLLWGAILPHWTVESRCLQADMPDDLRALKGIIPCLLYFLLHFKLPLPFLLGHPVHFDRK